MITGKAAILQYFDNVKQPYYAIFAKGQVEKGNAIFRNDKEGEGDLSFIDGKESFDRTLQLLGYSDYTLIISDKRNVTNRGGNRVDFRIELQTAQQPMQQQPMAGISGTGQILTMADVEKMADERFQKLMDKKELADTKLKLTEMEKELKDYEKKVNDPFNKFLTAAAPHSEHIIAGLFGGPKPQQAAVVLSGVTPDAVGEADPDAQQTVEDFIQALAKEKPGTWLQILKQLTTLIKENPTKFETALTFL